MLFSHSKTALLVTGLMLTACSPNATSPSVPSQSGNISSTPPTVTPSASVQPIPIIPSPISTGSPTSTVTPTTSPTETPEVKDSPASNTTQEDISVVEKTTFNGKVLDDTESPLDGVKVVAKSLNNNVSYTAETTTVGGTYAFNNAPAGVQIEITASREGYTTRRRVEVLKSNKQGDPDANRYDFGTDASNTAFGISDNALSDKPEVVSVVPGRNASGVEAGTSFVLTFSEPMDRSTVVDNFELRTYTSEKLSADTSVDTYTLVGSHTIDSTTGTRIWDKSAFNVTWNNDDTEATFTFLSERKLPTDTDSDKIPDYQVSLERQDKNIRDKSGISRNSNYFKLTEGGFERTYKFSINTDEVEPGVVSLTAATAENSGSASNGDSIKIRFTERMALYTLGPIIAGGMGGNTTQAAAANNSITGTQAAANYLLTVNRGGTLIYNQTPWSALGGSAVFDSNDPTHRTVLLLAPTLRTSTVVNGRPELNDNAALTAFFADGSSQVVSTGPFVLSGPGLSNDFDASYTIGGTGSLLPVSLEFTYTDGTKEVVNTAALDATPSDVDLKNILDNLTNGTPWTITDGNAGDFTPADTLSLRLNANATRLNAVPGFGNKAIAYVRFLNTANTAFANTALGQNGTSSETVVVPVNGDTGIVSAALNQGLDGQDTNNKFTVSESTGNSGLFETNDTLNITIQGSPTVAGRAPVRFVIAQSGMFASEDLNAPAEGMSLFAATTGSAANLYQPGDNVFVKVNSTVVDPAGNSLDTQSESANANAS